MFPATRHIPRFLFHALVIVCASTACRAADTPLVNLDARFDARTIHATDATVSLAVTANRAALHVVTGHAKPWPGITIPAPQGHWDLTAFEFVAAEIRNASGEPITVTCRVDNPGADGTSNCLNGHIDLRPGETGTLTVNLIRPSTLKSKLFGMRGYPYGSAGNPIDPANITQILFFVTNPKADHAWEVSALRAGGNYQPPPDNFFPFIDTFGQYMHRDWPGKVHSLDELRQRIQQEERELAANPGPADWDAWGGYAAGPTLKATGFFRVE
ncbi:MAG: hypothetical protein ACHRHE_01110, partial [Tepidisphaerales bacterium]